MNAVLIAVGCILMALGFGGIGFVAFRKRGKLAAI